MNKSFSTFVSLFLILSSLSSAVHGLKIPFQRRAPRGAFMTSPRSGKRYSFGGSTDKEDIGNIRDLRYTTNITINGKDVHVVLDTGSTDLWVNPPGSVGEFNDTGIPLQLLYGDGSYGVSGTIGVAPFKFGAYEVEKQAFMDVTKSTLTGMDELGVHGIFGLSFDFNLASPINEKIQSLYGASATWGKSVLQNIFEQNPTEPNFIAIDLSRTGDLEDTSGGSFNIGEYDPKYTAVADQTKLAQFPVGGNRWTTLLEGVNVDGDAITVTSTINGVPEGSAQALIDTGDPTAIFPTAMADAIYSKVPGAVKYTEAAGSVWIVPCNTTTSVELVFGGEKYPLHPLDLSTISDPLDINGKEYVACVSSFNGADGWGQGDYDISLGDSFLRNVYSVFDFGDTHNLPDGAAADKPYMQFLAQTDPTKAAAQVATIRGQTMASMPPEIEPAVLLGYLTGSSTTSPSSTDTASPISPTEVTTNDSSSASETKGGSSKSAIDATLGDNHLTLNVDDEVKKYGLIAICLLAANILIGLILIVFSILSCIRRGTSKKNNVASAPQYVPVKLHDEGGYSGQQQKPYGY